jgi:type I restriction-modification system DNA methylase subunit
MEKNNAKEEIRILLERYAQIMKGEKEIKSKGEEMTKKDLIRPLFERVLGWNFEEDVTAEEKISKGWVDYGFRINGVPKFFLEAKALSENLDDEKFFRQAVNYAYYKRCPWAVLTNFETVKILNAEWEAPNYLYSHFMTIKCNEFLDRFDDLWLLSKEGFEQGSLDRVAEKYGKRTKKTSVDKQLLNDFTKFRDMLSKNITKLNQAKNLTQSELDESIQRILDRLIFIRNCEDRGLEEKKLWEARIEIKVWKKLKEVFAYYDKNYDSKIFTYDPTDARNVHLCDTLDIDDSIMREIIESLYRTKDKSISYDFSIIDADVLGTVYEQYLSHILKKTEKRATLTENHAHKKEQGIYYTPTHIVDYIVRNALRELLEEKNVNLKKIKVLDPACGSGSFLIKVFDVLDEHYQQNDKDYNQTQLDFKTGTTFTRKVKILQDNIFGVDLDKQAVEIAQLNLLLKIAEKGHRLPLLERNIRRGNSLIDDESIAGNEAFKWEKEFGEIMANGGFSVIVGNPPYGAELSETERNFVSKKFRFAGSNKNTALLFIEKSLGLINENGHFGMIVPKSLAFSQLWKLGRELIKNHLTKVVDVSKAFEDVLLEQMIIILDKSAKTKEYVLQDIFSKESISIDKKFIDSTDSIILHGEKRDFEIFKKMNQSSKYLSDVSKTSRGLPFQKYLVKDKTKYPVVKGKTISRYNFWSSKEFLPEEVIEKNKKKATFLQQPKIISQRIVAHVTKPKDHIIIMSALDREGLMNVDTVENTILTDKDYSLEFLLCLLNSKLISWYAYRYIFSKAIRTMDLDDYYLGKIPLPSTKIDNSVFVGLAKRMLSINERLVVLGDKGTDERAKTEEERKKTDLEIDEQVYRIYGITENEKEIIEGSLK